jgi:hypothetical protein
MRIDPDRGELDLVRTDLGRENLPLDVGGIRGSLDKTPEVLGAGADFVGFEIDRTGTFDSTSPKTLAPPFP